MRYRFEIIRKKFFVSSSFFETRNVCILELVQRFPGKLALFKIKGHPFMTSEKNDQFCDYLPPSPTPFIRKNKQ